MTRGGGGPGDCSGRGGGVSQSRVRRFVDLTGGSRGGGTLLRGGGRSPGDFSRRGGDLETSSGFPFQQILTTL
jgi:hypothetical protein